MSHVAWSHSRVKDFVKCAYMFYMKSLAPKGERVKFVQSDAMKQGELQHAMLENYVSKGTPIPEAYRAKLQPIGDAMKAAEGQTFTELELTLNESLVPCGWFAEEAFVRVIIDVMKINGPACFVGDYKTGTPDFDEEQLKLFAAVIFQTFPEVMTVTTAYIWLKTGTLDSAVYTRDMVSSLWSALLVEPQRMQEANVMNLWPKRAGRWCKYCDVNREGKCDKASTRYGGG